jgi:nucleotide-binding universal stress UspA family protein
MEVEEPVPSVGRMQDDFQIGLEALEGLEGATPPVFDRCFVARQDAGPRRDAFALATALSPAAEAVNAPARADLIVAGSAPDGAPGRVTLEPEELRAIEGARAAVAAAPRGLAEREDYALRRIDVGIDGSREASAALSIAVRLALAHGARLRLIGVAQLAFDLDGTSRGADPREVERLARHLEQAADRLSALPAAAELREGLADQILIGLGREADLLVLGSRATYGGAGEVALGDVGKRILRGAPCPVLVVPAP